MKCLCVSNNYDDDDGSYVLKQKQIISKKEHVCVECWKIIKKNEQYELHQTVKDKSIITSRTCLDCVSIRNSFFCDGWVFGEIIQYVKWHIEEKKGEISSNCISPLTKRARNMVCDMIENYWKSNNGGK